MLGCAAPVYLSARVAHRLRLGGTGRTPESAFLGPTYPPARGSLRGGLIPDKYARAQASAARDLARRGARSTRMGGWPSRPMAFMEPPPEEPVPISDPFSEWLSRLGPGKKVEAFNEVFSYNDSIL